MLVNHIHRCQLVCSNIRMISMSRLFILLYCILFVRVKSLDIYESTVSVENITTESGLKFKPDRSRSLKLLSNNGCSICFRFMLKQHKQVALLGIGQSKSEFEIEIFFEGDHKTILQVRTSNDRIEEFNMINIDFDEHPIFLNIWHHFCFAIAVEKYQIIMILVCYRQSFSLLAFK